MRVLARQMRVRSNESDTLRAGAGCRSWRRHPSRPPALGGRVIKASPRRVPAGRVPDPSQEAIGPSDELGCACCHWEPTRACRAWRACGARRRLTQARPRLRSTPRRLTRGTRGSACSSGDGVRDGRGAGKLPGQRQERRRISALRTKPTSPRTASRLQSHQSRSPRSAHAHGRGARILTADWKRDRRSQAAREDGGRPRSS
jgi:hypothetical protein